MFDISKDRLSARDGTIYLKLFMNFQIAFWPKNDSQHFRKRSELLEMFTRRYKSTYVCTYEIGTDSTIFRDLKNFEISGFVNFRSYCFIKLLIFLFRVL